MKGGTSPEVLKARESRGEPRVGRVRGSGPCRGVIERPGRSRHDTRHFARHLQGTCKALCKAVLVVKSCANISSCFLAISLCSHWLPLAQPLLTARLLQGILHGTCAWQNLEAVMYRPDVPLLGVSPCATMRLRCDESLSAFPKRCQCQRLGSLQVYRGKEKY